MADVVKPHHLRQQAVEKRPDYRDSRWERAVKVHAIIVDLVAAFDNGPLCIERFSQSTKKANT